jgi:hypothetical protein
MAFLSAITNVLNIEMDNCKPILDIKVLRTFQRYKKVYNVISFDPLNHFPKVQKSIGIPIPKVGIHLGVCGLISSHFFALPGM